jgi:predicted transcriptional regulator
MDLTIRNLDDAAGTKLTQLAKKKHMSRESYIRKYLETLSVIDDMKQLDLKYEGLVKEMAGVIENNTQELNEIYLLLDQMKELIFSQKK